MKKQIKLNVKTCLLAFMLIFCTIINCSCNRKDTTEANYFRFDEVDGGYAIFAKHKYKIPDELVLPSNYKGKNVVEVGDSAFSMTKVKYLELPETIKRINNSAFMNCANLKSVNVKNVEQIGDYAFFGDKKLIEYNFNDKLISIGKRAFYDTSIQSVDLLESFKTVGEGAFENCKKLEKVYVGESVKSIGYSSFNNCNDKIKFVLSPFNNNVRWIIGEENVKQDYES